MIRVPRAVYAETVFFPLLGYINIQAPESIGDSLLSPDVKAISSAPKITFYKFRYSSKAVKDVRMRLMSLWSPQCT